MAGGWWRRASSSPPSPGASGTFGASVYLQAVTAAHGWPIADVAFAITLFYLVSALMQRSVGRGIDRWGPRPVLLLGAVSMTLGVAAIGQVIGALAALSLLRADRHRLGRAVDHRHRGDGRPLVRAPSRPVDGPGHHGSQRRRHPRRPGAAVCDPAIRARCTGSQSSALVGRGRAAAADRRVSCASAGRRRSGCGATAMRRLPGRHSAPAHAADRDARPIGRCCCGAQRRPSPSASPCRSASSRIT